jgi:hypothetical protein
MHRAKEARAADWRAVGRLFSRKEHLLRPEELSNKKGLRTAGP